MAMKFRQRPAAEERLKKLARGIEALARKDEERIRQAREIAELRKQSARELHSLCAGFVAALNSMLSGVMVELSPAEFTETFLRDPGVNVYQINASGRLVQVAFEVTDSPTSTDKIRVPYFFEGAVRCFNQELLERVAIHEMPLYCCLEKGKGAWVLFDAPAQRTLPFNQERLISMMELLL